MLPATLEEWVVSVGGSKRTSGVNVGIGVSPRYIAGIEWGERNLTLDALDEVARHLGLDLVQLFNGAFRDRPPEEQGGPVGRRVVPRPYAE